MAFFYWCVNCGWHGKANKEPKDCAKCSHDILCEVDENEYNEKREAYTQYDGEEILSKRRVRRDDTKVHGPDVRAESNKSHNNIEGPLQTIPSSETEGNI